MQQQSNGPLKVLFLSADTGGGHRASAESLARQFLIHYPGSTYDLLDIWTTDGCKPYNTLVPSYKHLSAHPRQWKFLYHLSNSRPWELAMDFHSTLMCERKIRRRIASYHPDVVVSVHPAMNNTPLIALRKLARASGRHIPFCTVVTDLGSGHCTWFQKSVDRLYVASDRLFRLARRRGRASPERIVRTGLPIRHDFAQTMTDAKARVLESQQLEKPMVLVMGGGEGVGSLSEIVDELYASLTCAGMDATLCVVCGRNEKLQRELAERDWNAVAEKRRRLRWTTRLFGQRRRKKQVLEAIKNRETSRKGKVDVVGMGFVTNMAEYMAAADVLVSKAGPGTIAEAAACGLPVMLTSFLPGQEAGNVKYVLDNKFGDYCEDPVCIAEEVTRWLHNPELLSELSQNSRAVGHPSAASEIVQDIGSLAHTWKSLNSS